MMFGDINKDNPLGTGGKLLEEVASLQQLMWSGKNGVRSPFKFRAQLGRVLQQYTGAEQQDAQVSALISLLRWRSWMSDIFLTRVLQQIITT